MPSISPSDSCLRRLHRINLDVLQEKASSLQNMEPVSIVKFRQPTGFEVLIVADGTHRVQAALEAGQESIEYTWGRLRDIEREARNRGFDFEDLCNRARRFAPQIYD